MAANGTHVEHVGEVELDRDGQLEADRLARVIHDVIVLVNPFLDGASQGHRQAPGLELELRSDQPRVRHYVASREEADRAGV